MIASIGDQSPVLVGYRPCVLVSHVYAEQKQIYLQMASETAAWLQVQFDNFVKQGNHRLLARLTLKGNFIWALDTPELYWTAMPWAFYQAPLLPILAPQR